MSQSAKFYTESHFYLPDGTKFKSWEQPEKHTRTYVVEGANPAASDDNAGTAEAPFRTIGRAAQVVGPGERVLIGSGIYRECVRPRRGGISAAEMITYEAKPGEAVVIRGSEEVRGWKTTAAFGKHTGPGAIWSKRLTADLMTDYNPFAVINLPYLPIQKCFDLKTELLPRLLARRGLVFQNGKRLRQVSAPATMLEQEGTFWAEADGRILHVRFFGDTDPNDGGVEITTREQGFAPEEYELGFIRVRGLTVEQIADGFPWPQRAAISTMRGHHWIIEQNKVRQVNACGIDIGCSLQEIKPRNINGYHIVRGNMIDECGVSGICGTGPLEGTLIEGNHISNCGWQEVEAYFECAGIKVHVFINSIIRKNVIRNMKQAAGIWMDWMIQNSRCSGNVIVDTDSMFGAIFVEASHVPNMVDNNFIWGSTRHGIYEHDTDHLMIAHNFVAKTQGGAIFLCLGGTQRWVNGRGATARGHEVRNNIIFDCDSWIQFANGYNSSEGNIFSGSHGPGPLRIHTPEENLDLKAWQEFHGHDMNSQEAAIEAELNRETFDLSLSVKGELPKCGAAEGLAENRSTEEAVPGPFGRLTAQFQQIALIPLRQ